MKCDGIVGAYVLWSFIQVYTQYIQEALQQSNVICLLTSPIKFSQSSKINTFNLK